MRIEFLERELSASNNHHPNPATPTIRTLALSPTTHSHIHPRLSVLKKEEAVEAIHAKNELRERVKVSLIQMRVVQRR